MDELKRRKIKNWVYYNSLDGNSYQQHSTNEIEYFWNSIYHGDRDDIFISAEKNGKEISRYYPSAFSEIEWDEGGSNVNI